MLINYSADTRTKAIFRLSQVSQKKNNDHKSVIGVFGYAEYDAAKIKITLRQNELRTLKC